MAQPVDAVVEKPKGSRSVVLLKNDDYRRKNNNVYIPNTIEMAQIKKPIRGQYKKNVQFSRNMDEDMVKCQLQEAFPTFDLKNGRFSCGAVSQDSITFQFHGTPRVWDGRTIRRLIKGNSVLYILMERNQVPQKLQRNAATEGCGSSTDTCMNPGNNTTHQTNEQTNPMDVHVPLDSEQMLFPEPTALINSGQTPCSVAETEMEVEDSQEGSNDELAVNGISTLSVNQVSDTPEDGFSSTTTSGMVSGSDPEFLEENLTLPRLPFENDVNFKVRANPDESPLKGGGPCCCTIDAKLLDGVTSGHAHLGPLGTVDLQRLPDGSLLFYFPAAIVTGSYPLLLESQDGKYLGDTTVTYYDNRVQKMVHAIGLNPCLQRKFFHMCMHSSLDGNNEHIGDEKQSSGSLEFTEPVEMLSLAVYAAAECGAQQFIEMIFTSSAGRIVFDVYKKNQVLPEVIAKDHGNNETAKYLEGITVRFSEEIRAGKECSQTIDWSELVKAAEAAEKELDLTSEKEDDHSQKDIPKETGYLGDIDTSSSESSEAQSSDSDDDISRPSRKEIQTKAEEYIQPVREASLIQSPVLFLKDGAFPRGKVYVRAFCVTKPLKCKENGLHLIQASCFQEAHDLQQVKYLQGSGISLLWGLGNKPVQHHLITTYQRLGYLLTLSTERNAYYKMHVDTAEDYQYLEHFSTTVENVANYKASRLDAIQQLCCRLFNGEFTATANREDLTVRGISAECLMEHCRSAAPNFWVLTYTFRPTRKTLFVYVADSKDVFPFASCFGDRQYELSWECQQWQGCKNNVPKVQEIYKFPAFLRLALEGYIKIWHKTVTVMLVGQATSGKSSFVKSIMREHFKPDEKSTMGIEVDPSHCKVSNEILKTLKEDHNSETSISVECHSARATVENLIKGKMVPSPEETEEHDSVPKDTGNQGNRSDETSHNPEFVQAVRYTKQDDSIPKDTGNQGNRSDDDPESVQAFWYFDHDDSILKVKRLVNDGNVDDEDVHSVLWDFAGQSVYYATHPIFLTLKAILVNYLSQNPNEKAKTVVKQGMYRKVLDSYCWKTNLDYLDFWMSSIASLANQVESDQESVESEVLPEKLPPVFLVCTHADMPYEIQVDPTTLTRELFGSLQNKPYNIHLHDLFVVDNTISSRGSECLEVVRLLQEILSVSKSLPQMKRAIPIKWLKYEKELQAMKEGGKKCIDQDAARTMASEACNIFDDQEFQTLLNFLHGKRTLIHFSDTPELDKLVVLDPQWLIDVFKEVIPVRPYNLKERKFQTLWNKLKNDGILERTLSESVWAPLVNHETFESVVGIMEKFILVCSWPSSDASCSKQYLVPSILMSHPPESTMSLLASARIPPLFPKFESGQVLVGLFPRLVLQFFQWDQEEQGDPRLYHNLARFYTSQNENCSVILLCHSSSIEVVVHKGTNQDLADSLQSKLSCSAGVAYDTCEVTCAHAVRKKLGLKLEVRNRSMCRTNSRMIKSSRGDFSSESKRCLSFFQWDQEEQGDPQRYHNFARFYTSQNEDCSVILLCPSSVIGVIVHKGTNQDLADSLQSKLSCSADVAYDTCGVTCAHTVRKKLELKLKGLIRSMCQAPDLMIKISRGDFSSESKRCVSLTVDKHNGGNLCNKQESSVKRRKESPCTSQKRPKPMPEHLAVERDEMESNICQKLLEKEWRAYDVENIPRGIEGIYCIGVLSGVPRHFHLGEPTVLYIGRTKDVHRRLVEHKRQYLKIDRYVKEEFEDNGGGDLRIKWIKEKNQETKEKEYIKCIAHKLGYWPKYNMRR